ncbi:uncharacterized protein G2W53_043129 [Senna tora]|uniref:Uncharacterized protein n=1 Tax=Senna tora TaxID=362788 RepID=A0A834VZK7_9FABA|nr:uncharacterized protein G2W53_043129 [Senna tora]
MGGQKIQIREMSEIAKGKEESVLRKESEHSTGGSAVDVAVVASAANGTYVVACLHYVCSRYVGILSFSLP